MEMISTLNRKGDDIATKVCGISNWQFEIWLWNLTQESDRCNFINKFEIYYGLHIRFNQGDPTTTF